MEQTIREPKFSYYYVASNKNFKAGWYTVVDKENNFKGSVFLKSFTTNNKDFSDRNGQWFGWGKSDGEIDFVDKNFVNENILFDELRVDNYSIMNIEENKKSIYERNIIRNLFREIYISRSSAGKRSLAKEAEKLIKGYWEKFPIEESKRWCGTWRGNIARVEEEIEEIQKTLVPIKGKTKYSYSQNK